MKEAVDMRKTDKKIDNQLRRVLTDVCETALKDAYGFQWLTHRANYANFPKSLKVVCVFDTNDNLAGFMSGRSEKELILLIKGKLREMGVELKSINDHIFYDTEENCERDHRGNWANRLGLTLWKPFQSWWMCRTSITQPNKPMVATLTTTNSGLRRPQAGR